MSRFGIESKTLKDNDSRKVGEFEMDREKIIAVLLDIKIYLLQGKMLCNSDNGKSIAQERINGLDDAIAMLKEQEEQKRKWLQNISDTQLAISPTGYESEDELAKRGWEWNGLQIAWEIIAGEERSEHPRLVRCKDCKWRGTNACFCKARDDVQDDWFCSEGERK